MRALIVVDVLYDFLPGGALPVPEGNQIIPVINALMLQFDLVVAVQDWHPVNHISFAASHVGKVPGDIIDVDGDSQVLWPVHCVQNTLGARIAAELRTDLIDQLFKKGTDPEIDSYSGFFDNAHKHATGLDQYLRHKGIAEIFVCGLAYDYCVRFTALDGAALGFSTFVIPEACRAIASGPEYPTYLKVMWVRAKEQKPANEVV